MQRRASSGVGRDDRPGRAGVDAGVAVAAVVVGGRVDGQWQVGIQLAEKEPGAGALIDQVGMLADPAQARVAARAFSSTGALSVKAR